MDILQRLKKRAFVEQNKDIDIQDAWTEIEKLRRVVETANVLYKQLHNIKQVRPRWANESVCEAMRKFGQALNND